MSEIFDTPGTIAGAAGSLAGPAGALAGALLGAGAEKATNSKKPAAASGPAEKTAAEIEAEKLAKIKADRKNYLDLSAQSPGRAGTVLSQAGAVGAGVASPYPFVTE